MKRVYPFALRTTEDTTTTDTGDQGTGDAVVNEGETVTQHWSESLGAEHLGVLKGFESFEKLQERLAATTVPEDYALPEGVEGIDETTFDGFKAIAKEIGLTQAQVDRLAKFDVERMQAMQPNAEQKTEFARNILREQFTEGLKQRASTLGDAKAKEEITLARAVMRAAAPDDLYKRLDETGIGDMPELVQMLANLGRMISEDNLAVNDPPAGEVVETEEEKARSLYSKTYK